MKAGPKKRVSRTFAKLRKGARQNIAMRPRTKQVVSLLR